MEQIVIYLLIVQKFANLKQKIPSLEQLCYVLERFQRTGLKIIWKKTRFNCYVYDFTVDFDAFAVDDILTIHEHLMKNNNVV